MTISNNAAKQSALEARVIGAVLGNPNFFNRSSLLPEEAFLDNRFSLLWKIISTEASNSRNIDPHSLGLRYQNEINGIGGLSFLDYLVTQGEQLASTFNDAIDFLHTELQWRRIAKLGVRLTAAANEREKDPNQILTFLQDTAKRHLSGGRLNLKTKSEIASEAIKSIREIKQKTVTGIDSLDLMMQGGLQPKRLYGVGASYGEGKTILLGTISDNLDRQQTPHLFISLETPPEDIELRSCAKNMGLNVSSIYDSLDPDHQVFLADADNYVDAMSQSDHTQYDYSPQATIDEIIRKILSTKSKYNIQGFIIDYYQLIRGRQKGQTLDEFFDDVADRLASICRTENLWGIITAQLEENGRMKTNGLYRSCSLFLRLCRDTDENKTWFITEKSNYTPYTDNGNESVCQMIFDDVVGPQFRNTEPTDIPGMTANDDNDTINV